MSALLIKMAFWERFIVKGKKMIKRKLCFIMSIVMLFTSGCSFGRRKEEKTTEDPVIYQSSGTDTFYDINADVESAEFLYDGTNATSSDADSGSIFMGYDASDYDGEPYIVVNDDIPFFDDDLNVTACTVDYGELDSLGRTQVSEAITCYEELPTEERGDIGDIKPSGWKQAKYEGVVDSEPPFLYNRCHLLLWAAFGNCSNLQENLITGTRYFNTQGMYPNEEIVLNFIKNNHDMHVRYRVTPYYTGDNLLADGVLMEAMSIEDEGASLSLCRWAWNVQPGVEIDYETGESNLAE